MMKRILQSMVMFTCIMICVAMVDISGYADGDPCTINWGEFCGYGTKLESADYYGTKEELLESIGEKDKISEVYIKVTLSISNNGSNTNGKITSVEGMKNGMKVRYNTKTDGGARVWFGPMSKTTPKEIYSPAGTETGYENTRKLKVNYSYKDEKGNDKSSSSIIRPNHADNDFDGSEYYGKKGNNPTGEIFFNLSGGTSGSGDIGDTSETKPLYRYDQKISLKANVADKGDSDIGVKSFSISGSGDIEINENFESTTPEKSCTHPTAIATSDTKYEKIKDYTYSGTITDGSGKIGKFVGKEGSSTNIELSKQILKHRQVDAEILPKSEFNPYVKHISEEINGNNVWNDYVVVRFKVTYGEEFIEGIANNKATTNVESDMNTYISRYAGDGRMKQIDVKKDDDGYIDYVIWEVITKRRPTEDQKIYLHYKTNAGGNGYTELNYELDPELAGGYEYKDTDTFFESNSVQKFDITHGNLVVDDKNVAHYGKIISGLTGETNDETESTVACRDIIMITGQTTEYTVDIQKGGKKIIFDKGLSMSNTSIPIKIKGGTQEDITDTNKNGSTSIVLREGGSISVTGDGQSGILIDGGEVNFYSHGTASGNKFKINSASGSGIFVDKGKINIKEVSNLEIVAKGGGAGVGANGSDSEIYIMNSALKIDAMGGGAAIGTGKNSTTSKIKVEGFIDGKSMELKVDSGACIGAGNNSTVSGAVELNNVDGVFTVGENGVAVGASNGGQCGNITVKKSKIEIKKNTNTGVGIGATGTGAKCGDIHIIEGSIKIEECTVGVGADTGAECGNITIDIIDETEGGGELKIDKGKVGVGAGENAKMRNIKIGSNTEKKFPQLDFKTTKVGIGSISDKTGESNIEFGYKKYDFTNDRETEVVISAVDNKNAPEVCIGAASGGKINNIKVTNCTKMILKPSTSGVGVGASGDSSVVKDITLSMSNTRIDSCKIGIGGDGTIGDIMVDSCGKDVVKSSEIGIGSSKKVGNITVKNTSIQIGESSSKSKIGIGVSGSSTEMGNITISNGNIMTIHASDIGIGSESNNTGSSSISIIRGENMAEGGSNIEITGVSKVGIGATGKIESINVEGNGSNERVSKITIKGSKDSEGVGIGASGTCGNIVVAANVQIGESGTKFKIGIGGSGTCGDIEVREGNNVVNNVVIYASNVGIGFDGSTATSESAIEIRNIKADISGCAVGIGATSDAKAGDIGISTLAEVDDQDVEVDSCSIKIVPTTTGIGIGGSGTCGNISCSGMTVQIGDSGTKCAIGIGTSAGTVGDIGISSCKITIYASGVGVGSETSNTSGKKISISGSNLSINEANVGVGTKGSLGDITIGNTSNVIVATASNGLGIGALGSDATVGDISLSSSRVKVSNSAIGIGGSGTCGKIYMTNCKAINLVSSNKVGIGTTKKSGAIVINSCNIKVGSGSSKSSVGIGTTADGEIEGDILMRACSNVSIYASDVGIGSMSNTTGNGDTGRIIYITGSVLNIDGPTTGIGAYGGNIGPIMIGNMEPEGIDNFEKSDGTMVKITGQGKNGVGIGSTGGSCVNICLSGSDVNVSGVLIGVGTDNQTGLIKIIDGSSVSASASKVGIGVTSDNGSIDLTVASSTIEVKGSPSVGIGTTENGKLKDISFNNSNIKVGVGTDGVGVGGLGEVSGITLKNSTQADIGVGIVGIGVSGSSGKCESISIVGCPSVLAYGSGVCIGNNGLASGSGACTIAINGSKVKVSGDGVGVGGVTNGVSEIKISGESTVVANTGSTGIGGKEGSCGNISISESMIKVNTNGGPGIGGTGTVSGITINLSTVNASATSTGSAIGGGSSSIGDIAIYESNVKTSSKDGMGIGGNSFYSDRKIDIKDSELDITTTGGGTGIGSNTGTLGSIAIKNSAVKINGGAGAGVGIGVKDGVISGIDLTNNIISILKTSGSTGAGIGSGANGNAGNMNLTKNKIVVATDSGACIGSGAGGKVTGTITIDDGVIIGKSTSGACIGAGNGGSVNYISIEDGKINANVGEGGVCIGTGVAKTNINRILSIAKGKLICNGTSTAKGLSAADLYIYNGDICVNTASGDAINGSTSLSISNGKIEAFSSGANAISGGGISIYGGVVKAKGGTKDIKGSSIKITRNANVQAYNNTTTSVTRDGRIGVTQRKLTIGFWRNCEGIVNLDGSSYDTIKTDSSGNIYFWYNESEDSNMTFDMDGKRMVMSKV